MGNKTSFVLYHDIRGPLELLTDEQRGKLFMALLDYSEFAVVPDFDGELRMAFAFIRTALDRDAAAWESKREKRAEAGRKGGKQTQANQAFASFAYQTAQTEANQAAPAPVSAPAPANKERMADKPPAPTRTKFVPPTVEQVRDYCKERGNSVDPERFVDYYTTNGWVQGGGKPIKDWRACVRTWERNGKEGGTDVRNTAGDSGKTWNLPGVVAL